MTVSRRVSSASPQQTAACSGKREAVCVKKASSTRTIARTAVFAFLLPCIANGPASTSATVFSEDLRGVEEQSLLFWSTFEMSIDAALQYLGPVDTILRGSDAAPQNCLDPHDISSLACGEQPPFFDDLISSVDEMIGSMMKNLSEVFSPKETDANGQSGDKPSVPIQLPRGGARGDMTFSLYQKGDGSESDPDSIPTRYVQMHKGDRDLAQKSLESTLKWREENDIDRVLVKPHPKFDIAKKVFPHYFLGRDKHGDVLFLQRPALLDLPKAKKNGLSKEDLLMHYIYVNEYLWQVMEGHKPLGTMTSVIDLTGLQLGVLRKREMIAFLKLFVQTMDNHFPQRAHKTLLLNAPKWFNTLFKLLSPLMREETKKKIEIHSRGKKQDEALKKYLSEEARNSLPASFWSKDKSAKRKGKKDEEEKEEEEKEASFNTKLEEELRSFAVARLKDSGKKMIQVA